ncbi:SufD family Fe-S cluster assembly protein [Candidatus Woesearchaeota archaeon]|nr:SufD family Fe-S cluster assembly protein [Candidatus Woesearchaeota archaeon]
MKSIQDYWQEKKQIAKNSYTSLPPINYNYGSQIKSEFLNLDWTNLLKNPEKNDPLEKYPLNKEIKIYDLNTLPAELFNHYFARAIPIKENKITSLHYNLLNSLTFIVIPKNISIKEPVYLTTSFQKGLNASHIVILAEENSQANIYDLTESSDTALSTIFRELFLLNNSNINYYTLYSQNKEISLHNLQVELFENSHLNVYEFLIGGNSLHNFNARHLKSHACFHYHCAFLANNNTTYDLSSSSIHSAKKTSSSLNIKGLTTNKAKALFRGKIKILPRAKFSSGHQHSSLIILGNDAHAEAVPILEVENNEISCSHGAAISRINEEQLFYLKSRGISSETAQEILINAHLSPIINQFPDSLQTKIYSLIQQSIISLKKEPYLTLDQMKNN